MRQSAIALLCGLAAAAALVLAWRSVDAPAKTGPAPAGKAPASHTAVPPAPPASTSAVPRPVAPTSPPAARVETKRHDTPLALSSDHRALLQDTLLASSDLHKLEQEPRDNDWAPEAERLIRGALARHASFAGFDLIAVDCRSTLCAIQAFSYGEEGNQQWVRALDDLYRESLVDTFDALNTAFPTRGGRAAVLSFLHRKPASLTTR